MSNNSIVDRTSGIFVCLIAILLAGIGRAMAAEPSYFGNYRIDDDHLVGIDRFINDAGEHVVLFSDYESGVVRRLFPVTETDFVMGPASAVREPVELLVRFQRDARGATTGLSLQPTGGKTRVAKRVPLNREDVVIVNGDARLAGTLILPTTKGPHPAIILLHGSGPLTRYSFGPYPHFFTSLGFAVLVFDKRGAGNSTGTRLDASTGAQAPVPNAFYPDDLVNDALAAFSFLEQRSEIDPKRIGLWGSSEGGMLTTQVAARNPQVAFAINSSGFMGPLWETLLYQAGAIPKSNGLSEAQAREAREFARFWLKVARTGEEFDLFVKKRDEARNSKDWLLSYFSGSYESADQMHWDWEHILVFDPLPALTRVKCPVLGLFGELDPLTEAPVAARNMREALSRGGNKEFSFRIFPKAGHSLSELPSKSRMSPGVFEALRSWLLDPQK